jgi:hypothetical protein
MRSKKPRKGKSAELITPVGDNSSLDTLMLNPSTFTGGPNGSEGPAANGTSGNGNGAKHAPLGRPRKDFATARQLEAFGRIGAITAEIAEVCDVNRSTVDRRLKACPALMHAYKKGLSVATMSLRRAQLANALKGNAVMQIWLGKQLLGQVDTPPIQFNDRRTIRVTLVRSDQSRTASETFQLDAAAVHLLPSHGPNGNGETESGGNGED